MKKCNLFTILSVLVICTTIVSAGSKQDKNDKQNSRQQANYTIVAYNNLSLAIDFWHDANLKGNKKAIAEHKQMIFEIINENIKDSYQSISYAKLDASYTQKEFKESENKLAKTDDKYDFKNDKRDLQNEESMLRAKQLLFESLQKSKTFSYSYRLLADYQQLLKKELDANKIEMAEDDSGVDQGAGGVRFIR